MVTKRDLKDLFTSKLWVFVFILLFFYIIAEFAVYKEEENTHELDKTFNNIDEILIEDKVSESLLLKEKHRVRVVINKRLSYRKDSYILRIKIMEQKETY